jgi:hypothetical protein
MVDIVLLRHAERLGAPVYWSSSGAYFVWRGQQSEFFQTEDEAARAAISRAEEDNLDIEERSNVATN